MIEIKETVRIVAAGLLPARIVFFILPWFPVPGSFISLDSIIV